MSEASPIFSLLSLLPSMHVTVYTFHCDTDHGQETKVFTTPAALCQAICEAVEKRDPDFVCTLAGAAFESPDWLRSWSSWQNVQANRHKYFSYSVQQIEVPEQQPSGLFVMQVPTISLAHITKADWEQLSQNRKEDSLAVVEDGEGHILVFEGPAIEADFSDTKGFSQAFRKMLQHFARLGFQYLRLAPDFDACPALPTFEW